MEGNLRSLFEGAITPWLGPKGSDVNEIPVTWQWPAFDLTKSQTYAGVIRDVNWASPIATAKIEVAGKIWDVALGPPVRLDFRRLGADDVKVGGSVRFQAVPSRQSPNELRAEIITIGDTTADTR